MIFYVRVCEFLTLEVFTIKGNSVSSNVKITDSLAGVTQSSLDDGDRFDGYIVLEDLENNVINDLVVDAYGDDENNGNSEVDLT